MNHHLLRFVALLIWPLTSLAFAQESPSAKADKPAKQAASPAADDVAAIRAAAAAFETAFNAGDARAIAALWTEDGDYHDESGTVYRGRSAIAAAYTNFLKANPGLKITIAVDAVRLLSDTAAIEDGRTLLNAHPGAPGYSRYTAVHVKVDGKWLMSTVRDTHVATPSAYEHLADFEWMVGSWAAESHGTKTAYDCQWIANKSFLERRYTVTHPDQSVTTGVQIIGWDPATRAIQSWNFSSDGGTAVGLWQPHASGYAAELHGTTGEGVRTTAFNVFRKLDDDTFAWQSVQRTVGDQRLPDTEEVIVKRQSK